ncbi:MAG: phospholipid carrier-dependent glycosyltransferase [Sphingobacteriaceae bacterium]|nr:phospholipid carrier-dependent glycosyltransferase [Sphingobacteriaceae bacterium]
MRLIDNFLSQSPGKVFAFLILLAIPAFFINLGLLPLFADEPTRANVALEMILSENYSVPTIGAEFYYNKPPVYNWVLAVAYQACGNFSEFVTRLPAIIPLFLFAATIYISVNYFLKDKRIALVSAMLSMLNGRMLIYDSMLGHIDIFYSWLTFISFMCIFYFYQKKQWFLLFFSSYIITAITFLCKGMPSIVFQGITIIAFLLYTKNFSKLFGWKHILSGIFCLLIIALYFYNYSLYNPNLEGYLETIWDQSSQRTAASVGFWKSIKHILAFPFEYIGHLFPASLLLLFCLHGRFLKTIWLNPFLKFCTIIFLANSVVYWLSPETRPRYLLMLFPLLFIVWSHAYYTYRESLPGVTRAFNIIIIALAIAVTVAIPVALFAGMEQYVRFLLPKVILVFCLSGFFAFLIIRLRDTKLFAFLALLLVVRLGFSWFVLPHRLQHDEGTYYRSASQEMGRIAGKNSFYFYQYHPEVQNIPFHDKLIFYIQRERMKQVKFTEIDTLSGYYLTFDRDLKNPGARLLKTYNSNLKLYKIE